MTPKFFKSQSDFRKWLEKNHDSLQELWVGFYKKGSGKGGITYPQALDEALCFGWIDGIRKSIDETSYTIRFTPRTSRSIWSAVNIKRATELKELGLMTPAGLKAFEGRDPSRANLYSFEQENTDLGPAQERQFKANKAAWKFFTAQAATYQKVARWWVISAKKEETRSKRLATLIETSEKGSRLPQFVSPSRRKEK